MNVNHQILKENVKPNKLTPEALRQYPGLDTLSDNDAQAIIESLAILAQVAYEVFNQQQDL